jgi:hypothetical protein
MDFLLHLKIIGVGRALRARVHESLGGEDLEF